MKPYTGTTDAEVLDMAKALESNANYYEKHNIHYAIGTWELRNIANTLRELVKERGK